MDGLTLEELELLEEVHLDIHALFVHYNSLYFESKLGACSVEWSSARMTLCGGVCEFRRGGGARIKLSEPLLKLRPSRDVKMVLLHEMIHAFLMLQGIRDDDPGGHGTRFKSIMARINASQLPDHQRPPGGYNITVTHTMFAEVDFYRKHHWRCRRCGGLVKRANNREPQEADCRTRAAAACSDPGCRWHVHLRSCGGSYEKIQEPEGYVDKRRGKKDDGKAGKAGGGFGGTPRRADGEPVPAKRPRKARKPEAAPPAGSQPLTNFFRRPGEAAGAGGAAAPPAAGAGVLPALQPFAGAAPAAAVGPSHQGEQSAEERRRVLAEAAMRRLAGAAAHGAVMPPASLAATQQQQQRPVLPPVQQQQQQQQRGEGQQEQAGGAGAASSPSVVDLLDSSDGEDDGRERSSSPRSRGTPLLGAATRLGEAGGRSGGLECPVCGRVWRAGDITNVQLNAHMDECLNLSYQEV